MLWYDFLRGLPQEKLLCTQCLLLYCIHFLAVSTVQRLKPLRSSWRARIGYNSVERFRLCSTDYQKSDSQWSWSLQAHWCWVITVQHIHKTILDILGNNWRLVLVCIALQETDKMLDLREKYQYFKILMDLPITPDMDCQCSFHSILQGRHVWSSSFQMKKQKHWDLVVYPGSHVKSVKQSQRKLAC